MITIHHHKSAFKAVSAIVLIAACIAVGFFAHRLPQKVSEVTSGSSESLVAVDATVYRGLMQMLGIGDRCVDFSDQMKPDVEQVVASGAKMLMLSAYDGVDIEKYRRTGLRIVECTDFKETSPLARAKWMTVYGRIWGVGERADSLYDVVETRYRELTSAVSEADSLPVVFFDLIYGNLWYQPTSRSSTGGMVGDAGGRLPFADDGDNVTLTMSKEQVLSQAKDADVWIIRYHTAGTMTLDELGAIDPVYGQFKAFREGNVWACNTDKVSYFDEAPFRPDYLLQDMINILHPEMHVSDGMRYFEKLR